MHSAYCKMYLSLSPQTLLEFVIFIILMERKLSCSQSLNVRMHFCVEGVFGTFLQWSCATTGGELLPVRWKHRCLKGEFRADRCPLRCGRPRGTLNFRMNTDREIGVSRSFWLFKLEMSKELPQGQLVYDEQVLRPLCDPSVAFFPLSM